MNKLQRITARIEANKELQKDFKNISFYTAEPFIEDATRYIKAIKDGRIICAIDTVSRTGMSRTIKFLECSKNKRNTYQAFSYLNFFAFFRAMGYNPVNSRSDYFRINGCGMDMIFATNYDIIHSLQNLGFISKKECSSLAQNTPTII